MAAKTDNSDRTVVIDLTREEGAAPDPDVEGRLHQDAYQRVIDLLLKPIPDDPSRTRSKEDQFGDRERMLVAPNRVHDAIAVSAPRGGGKTTFLVSILRDIEKASEKRSESTDERLASLASLGLIDPTLIETKHNIMVMIIDRIWLSVKSEISGNTQKYRDCEDHLRKLARGLRLLDGIGDDRFLGQDWIDEDYVLDEGIANAGAAAEFGRLFNQFVDAACSAINKEAFILAIDDIDTHFERGWPVLEAIRKYMACRRLKIVVSGDLQLFSLLVRREQWSQLGDNHLKSEKVCQDYIGGGSDQGGDQFVSRMPQIIHMIDQLEDQYLTKILPAENRISLNSLSYYLSQNYKVQFTIQKRTLDEVGIQSKSVESIFFQFSNQLLALKNYKDTFKVQGLFMRQPLRTTVQTLRGARALLNHPEQPSKPQSDDFFRDRQAALDALRAVAWGRLSQKGLNPETVRQRDPRRLILTLIEWFTETDWKTLPRLFPEQTDDTYNLVAVAVAASFVDAVRDAPGAMIDYMLKVAQTRDLYDTGRISGRAALREFSTYANLNTAEDCIQTVSRIGGWANGSAYYRKNRSFRRLEHLAIAVPQTRIRNYPASLNELYGYRYQSSATIQETRDSIEERIPKLSPAIKAYWSAVPDSKKIIESIKTRQIIKYYINTVDSLVAAVSNQPAASYLRLCTYSASNVQGAEQGMLSFTRLIALFSRFMDISRSFSLVTENNSAQIKDEIRELLTDACANRSYPVLSSNSAPSNVDEKESEQQEVATGSMEDDPDSTMDEDEDYDVDEQLVEALEE
jgi:hypothetical protein